MKTWHYIVIALVVILLIQYYRFQVCLSSAKAFATQGLVAGCATGIANTNGSQQAKVSAFPFSTTITLAAK